MAERLIQLVGLNKTPLNDPEAKDLRWEDRREAWDKATRCLKKYQEETIDVEAVVDLCKGFGHWSIWMTVFSQVDEVRLALIDQFPGTAACFDQSGNPTLRVGGHL
jgi:hypothetical protein